ncbi:MAG: hypothetical protein IJO01_02430 [Oscillospiraceae bacterium]|nr:hypothetical protein [Oscillospiraceae bacterium]
MKKFIKVLLFSLVLMISICACGSTNTPEGGNNDAGEVVEPEPEVVVEYFEEFGDMATPDTVVPEIEFTGSSKSSTDGVTTKIEYRYSIENDSLAKEYIDYLRNSGIEIVDAEDGSYSVMSGKAKVCTITVSSGSITVNIVPEDFRVEAVVKKVAVGSYETTDFAKFTFKKLETTKEVYPNDVSGVYLYYKQESGYKFITLRGTVKNLAAENLEGRYINAVVSINDKYNYDCEVIFGANPSALTDYAITPFEESPLYIIAKVPNDALSAMTSGTLTVQFNENFGKGIKGGDYAYTYVFNIPK